MHNFALSEEQVMVQETVRKLVQDTIGPRALEFDEHRTFARSSFEQLAETGFFGLPVGEDSGGAGLGMLSLAIAIEELARGCGSTARLFLVHAGMCGKALEGSTGGADLLGELMAGSALLSWIGPEAEIAAQPVAGGFALTGRAALVTGAAAADRVLVLAHAPDGPLLLDLEAADGSPAPAAALGFRAAAPGSLTFSATSVPAARVVAAGEDAAAAASRAGLAAAIGGAALALGLGDAAFQSARRYAHERVAFGKPLFAQQAVRHKLEASLRGLQAARHLTLHAARLADAGEDAHQAAMLARLDAVTAAVAAADEAIQIHGGYGYTVEYHVERHYRDAKTLEVLDGGAEKLRDAIAAGLALR